MIINTILIDKLKKKIETWKVNDYEGVLPETRNILNHIYKIGFLYEPQIEAFETYIYLKEILGNKTTSEIVPTLYENERELIESLPITSQEKYDLAFDENRQSKIKELIEREYGQFDYPNQVYALTMGSGKTILMGTMILYEFVLSVKHPDDSRFAKNVLVFAPDTTIIESLKEIKSFDYSKVIPNEYQNVALNIKYHYLESTETAVNFIGNYNIIVSNSQKIIIKTKHKQELNLSLLTNEAERKKANIVNTRLKVIQRLQNLSVIVDEAHHSYGKSLEGALKKTRETINFLHKEGQTPLVNVINLTGTPYVKNKFINDVVYHFGLKQGIEKGILKQVKFFDYEEVKTEEFIDEVVTEFTKTYGENRLEGKLPKIAFYASNIKDELQQNLRPALEKVLISKGISTDKILEYHTEKEENREEFLKLDTPESTKQYILLVGKGTEGWNVRSLVSTALFRKQSSSIFVLQSSTRCLRSIGDNSTHASIFLSEGNAKILDQELKNNFGITRAEIEQQTAQKIDLTLNVLKTKKIKVKKELHEVKGIVSKDVKDIKISSLSDILAMLKQGKATTKSVLLNETNEAILETESKDITNKKVSLPTIHFITQVSLRTHLPCLVVKEVLANNKYLDGQILLNESRKDEFLDLISSEIVSKTFDYKETTQIVEEEIELTKNFPFKLSRDKNKQSLIIYKEEKPNKRLGFHINPYAFDSSDELDLFGYFQDVLEKNEVVTDVYFTGNISDTVHTDFYFEYWNPQEQRMARYFPDFLIETNKGRFIVVEVKSDSERTDYLANKKQYDTGNKELTNVVFAKEIGFMNFKKVNSNFDYHIVFNAGLQQKQRELLEALHNDFKK